VVDRYANKGLRLAHVGALLAAPSTESGLGRLSLSPIFLKSFLCELCVCALRAFPVFFHSQKVHYNALSRFSAGKSAL